MNAGMNKVNLYNRAPVYKYFVHWRRHGIWEVGKEYPY